MKAAFNNPTLTHDLPLLIWDGECSFCHYWLMRFLNSTGTKTNHLPFQSHDFPFHGITESECREAVKYITSDGIVYSGAAAIFKVHADAGKYTSLYRYYQSNSFFRKASEYVYRKIAANRRFAFKGTKVLWGKNPSAPRPYWMLYLAVLITSVYYCLS